MAGRWLKQRLELAQGFHDDVEGGRTFFDGFACLPIQALDLIRQHDAYSLRVVADNDFEGITLLLASHGTTEHQPAGPIVAGR